MVVTRAAVRLLIVGLVLTAMGIGLTAMGIGLTEYARRTEPAAVVSAPKGRQAA